MATFLQANAVQTRKLVQEATKAQATKAQRSRVALSMYSDLPEGEIAIEEFERFAMDRLRGEQAAGRGRRRQLLPPVAAPLRQQSEGRARALQQSNLAWIPCCCSAQGNR